MQRAAIRTVLIVIAVLLGALLGVVVRSRMRSHRALDELRAHGVATVMAPLQEDFEHEPWAVRELQFRQQEVSPAVLENVIWLTNARALHFEECRISSDCAEVFERLVDVETLVFVHCEIDEDVLSRISSLPELRFLNFVEMDVGPEHLSAFESSKGIIQLNCRGSRLSTDIGNTIASTGVQHVILRGSNVTDDLLAGIENDSALNSLDLQKTAITDATVQRLSANSALRTLDLSDTNVTDQALESLAVMPALVNLFLNDTRVTVAGVADLLEKRRFRRLSFTCPESEWEACDVLHRRFPELAVTRDSASSEETESPAD